MNKADADLIFSYQMLATLLLTGDERRYGQWMELAADDLIDELTTRQYGGHFLFTPEQIQAGLERLKTMRATHTMWTDIVRHGQAEMAKRLEREKKAKGDGGPQS